MQYVKGTVVAAATLAGVAGVLVLNPTGTEPLVGATAAVSAGAETPQAGDSTPETIEDATDETKGGSTAQAAPSRSAPASATYSGAVYNTPWGPLQLEATVEDGVIVDIAFINLPSDPHSASINGRAAPQLIEEGLAAQSAHVDSISGASWTSEGFRYSLQSILTEAGL